MRKTSNSAKTRKIGLEQDADAQRQANGRSGEDLTRGLLGPTFVVSSVNIDKDGADLWISEFDKDKIFSEERLRIQAKFAKRGNQARFRLEHAMTADGKPRPDYFAFVHTLSAGELVHYFFDSAEILKLPRTTKGQPFFTPGAKSTRKPLTRSNVVSRLRKALQAQKGGTSTSVNEMLLSYQMRSAVGTRGDIRYLLKRVSLPEVPNMERGFPIVLAADQDGRHLRLIDARLDLHPTSSTFEWGYSGGGPKFTAWCILAHYFGEVDPIADQVRKLVDYLLSQLDRGENHEITAGQIDDALKGISPTFRQFLDEKEDETVFEEECIQDKTGHVS